MRRRLFTLFGVLLFASVLISFFIYTRQMEAELRRNAAAFGTIYARVIQGAAAGGQWEPDAELEVLSTIESLQVAVVLADTLNVPTFTANLPFEVDLSNPSDVARIQRYIADLAKENPPLVAPARELAPDTYVGPWRIYYGESLFLRRLKWIPVLQAGVLLAMAIAGAWAIRTSFRSERERIWSAMARESAHQMGTPLSSLSGWLERLGEMPEIRSAAGESLMVVGEMEDDVERLKKVSRRFELIGHPPTLRRLDVGDVLERLRRYFSVRMPRGTGRVEFSIDVGDAPPINGNETLIEWAFENLIKNSLDALAGEGGRIGVEYSGTSHGLVSFLVSDSGPGVRSDLRKSLFEIGVSTKERGWGVGLSLTKRIITIMHDGRISLDECEGGACFRVELPVYPGNGNADRA